MYIKGLDGKQYKWKPKGRPRNCPSKLHLRAKNLLNKLFGEQLVLEEVSIKLQPKKHLYLDFYLPLLSMAVEVHGKQHYEYIQQFHISYINFLAAQLRDLQKVEWCKQNNIELIILPYNEENIAWEYRLNGWDRREDTKN